MKKHVAGTKRILFLISNDFDESNLIYCFLKMRECGLPATLVGLTTDAIVGLHGLKVYPDLSVEALAKSVRFDLIVLPGNLQCLVKLRADPRVYTLFEALNQGEGNLAVLSKKKDLLPLDFFDFLYDVQVFNLDGGNIDTFSKTLIEISS